MMPQHVQHQEWSLVKPQTLGENSVSADFSTVSNAHARRDCL